jgi:hypothetical protein
MYKTHAVSVLARVFMNSLVANWSKSQMCTPMNYCVKRMHPYCSIKGPVEKPTHEWVINRMGALIVDKGRNEYHAKDISYNMWKNTHVAHGTQYPDYESVQTKTYLHPLRLLGAHLYPPVGTKGHLCETLVTYGLTVPWRLLNQFVTEYPSATTASRACGQTCKGVTNHEGFGLVNACSQSHLEP